MKTFLISTAAVMMLALSGVSANAGETLINIEGTSVDNDQVTHQDVNQGAGAIALVNGAVDDYSDVTANALNSVNLATASIDVDQNSIMGNGAFNGVGNDQDTLDVVNQGAGAAAGANGYVDDHSNVGASASNLTNTFSVDVTVTQD